MRFPHIAVALILTGLTFTSARAEDRSAEAILKDIDAVVMPQFDPSKGRDQAAVQEYLTKRKEALANRNPLILELFRSHPKDDHLPKLMPERWLSMSPSGADAETIRKEIDEAVQSGNAELRTEARFLRVRLAMIENRNKPEALLPAVEAYLKEEPEDPRGVSLLYSVSKLMPEKTKAELEKRLLKEYPGSRPALMIASVNKRKAAIGKPIDLEFSDAITGSTVSMKGLKGKVVVLDFWATWCGPCVAEMPHMKELYAKYKGQGVEFIGVSLDQPKDEGGLDKLKAFVDKNKITWPQYYQGDGWESEFSSSWGINSIPAVFVVDADGNLYSIEARGKLDKMIPDLLEKAGKKPDAGE